MKVAVDRDAIARARTTLFERNGILYGPRSEGIGRYALAGDDVETSPRRRKQATANDLEQSSSHNVIPIRPIKQTKSTRKAAAAAPRPKSARRIPGLIEMED
jgi:hypothetical protein